MNWFQKLFGGGRTRKVASGSLPLAQLNAAAWGFTINLKAAYGVDVTNVTVENTNSMIPTLDSNCVLLLEKVPFESLQEGDIVTYRPNRALWSGRTTLICHRLNEKTAKGWWPLGDGNQTMDPESVTPANFDRRVMGLLYARREADTDQ